MENKSEIETTSANQSPAHRPSSIAQGILLAIITILFNSLSSWLIGLLNTTISTILFNLLSFLIPAFFYYSIIKQQQLITQENRIRFKKVLLITLIVSITASLLIASSYFIYNRYLNQKAITKSIELQKKQLAKEGKDKNEIDKKAKQALEYSKSPLQIVNGAINYSLFYFSISFIILAFTIKSPRKVISDKQGTKNPVKKVLLWLIGK